MKIVITGALGHIGSQLIRNPLLYSTFDEVILVDNLQTQRFPSLFHLPVDGGISFIDDDLNALDLERLLTGPSVVVHLAALTDAATSFGRLDEFRDINLGTTQKIAEAASSTGSKLIFPSSTSVYGAQSQEVDENCQTLNPQSPYAEVKIDEENAIRRAAEGGLAGTILRLGTIFGVSPGMRFHTAVNRFCWDASLGRSVRVWREALDQVRPYLDLNDACSSILSAALRNAQGVETFNILTLNATVSEVLSAIEANGRRVIVDLVDSPILNQTSYHVSTKRWIDEGFTYSGDLTRSVGETLDLFRALR